MTNTITKSSFVMLIALLFLTPVALFAYDAGNDATSRTLTDTWINFTIVDTNNPFLYAGNVSEFEYYAANTNPFRILIVDGADVVQYVSEEIVPVVGAGTYDPTPYVSVEAGWNLAIYSALSGVVPHDKGGSTAEYEGYDVGLPVKGETLAFVGTSDRTYSVNATLFDPVGEIIAPTPGEIVYGDYELFASYNDGDDVNDDEVNWAVRPDSPTCNGGGNLFGGGPSVPGVVNPTLSETWDGSDFSATIDTSLLSAGEYCFVFNPTDDDGQDDIREVVHFYVAESYISGGGQILEKDGNKKKDWFKISFGGWAADIGELVGSWEVNFHNVGAGGIDDKSKFHGEDITELNLYAPDSNTCTGAMNLRVNGEFNGVPDWSMIIRAGDEDDTMRFELYNPSDVKVYDTIQSFGDFTDESSCRGTARTGLDNGNITIVDNS